MLTDKDDIIDAFWDFVAEVKRNETSLHLTRKKIPNYSGNGTMYNTDTRCTFVDWLDGEVKAGTIDPDVAQDVTLDD